MNKWTDIITTKNGKYVLIDTCYTLDHGWESMVFECDCDGNVKSWIDLDVEIYDTMDEANEGHQEMINRWMNKRY